MESQDILITIVYSLLILFVGAIIQILKSQDRRYRFFILALFLKIVGAISFASIYKFYYGYGDTFGYFNYSVVLTDLLKENPKRGLEILFYFKSDVGQEVMGEYGGMNRIVGWQNTFLIVKLGALVNLLSFSNFFGSTILFSLFSFIGMWIGYLSITKHFTKASLIDKTAAAFFFIPSVFFWGSGVMKDSVVLGFLGILIYTLKPFGRLRIPGPLSLILILISGYIIFTVKAYVIFCLVPALALWYYLSARARMTNVVLRNIVAPILLLLLFSGAILSIALLGQFTEKFQLDQAFETAKIYQDYHYTGESAVGEASGYALPDYGNQVANAVLNIPAAINVTLFRPYPWEISSAVVSFAALESLVLLLFSLRILFKKGFKRIMRFLGEEPFLWFILAYILLFSYIIGFSSYNFGALVRYKIQCLPFFIFLLFYVDELLLDKSKLRLKTAFRKT